MCVPRAAKELTPEQRKKALGYLMFLKRKRTGKVKARGCADGRPQHEYTSKAESTAPTVTTEAVLLTAVIDALERRDVATVDLPGFFMQTNMEDEEEEVFFWVRIDHQPVPGSEAGGSELD